MIGALIALISLDMTRKLVAAGAIASTITITGATNTTPIVITTSTAHKLVRPTHAVISGVAGNTAANGQWVMTPTGSPTTLRLTTFSEAGTVVNSVGSGSYVSGGIAQIAFPDGSILLGRRNLAMQMAVVPPRIVFVPMTSPAWSIEPYGGVIPTGTRPRTTASQTAEQKFMKQHRQLATEQSRFEVHVTGCATPPDPDFGDFDATQSLYHALYGTMFEIIGPSLSLVLGGRWASQDATIQTLDTHGQKWIGLVEIPQPVIPDALSFVPVSTDATITINFVNGSSGDATVVEIPPV